jgi:ATP-binding cassette subfamily B multidrug efflux pump
MKSLTRLLAYLQKYSWLTLGAFASLILTSAASLATPAMIQVVIDRGIAGRVFSIIGWVSLAMVGVALLNWLFSYSQGYLSARVSQGVAYDLRNVVYGKIQTLSFSYHDRVQTGQLLTRATNDVDIVRTFIGMGLLQLISAVLMIAGSLVLLFAMDWQLAAIVLIVMLVAMGVFAVSATRMRPLFTLVQQKLSALNTVLQENLAGVRVVKAFVREPFEAGRFDRSNRELLEQSLAVGRMMSSVFPLIFLISNMGTLAIIWIGGLQVIGGRLSLGQLVAFNNYLLLAFFPVIMLGMIVTMISRAAASAERIFEILDARSEVIEVPGAPPLPPIRGEVFFKGVSFRYFDSGEYVLRDISFTVRPGQTIALLGATGSGKSTIINLIPRFYDVTDGQITIDGYDIRTVALESLRCQIGIVLQETTLFSGTIRENIAYGRPGASMEEVIAAARAAEAHDFIMSFPQGYGTEVGERGVTLSGGQKQRIAIARALLVDPHILILDDSASSVDLETEYRIRQALEKLMVGRTSFVIAQRISTVLDADQILVLDKGQIVAQGTHEELIQESPIYAEIYCSQLREDEGEVAGEPCEQVAFATEGVA